MGHCLSKNGSAGTLIGTTNVPNERNRVGIVSEADKHINPEEDDNYQVDPTTEDRSGSTIEYGSQADDKKISGIDVFDKGETESRVWTELRSNRDPWKKYLESEYWNEQLKISNRKDTTRGIKANPHGIEMSSIAQGDFSMLPEDYPKVFAIFVSSTFTDTEEERNLLIEDVQPYLREICSLFGYEFRFCEMRWGVRDEASEDHQTADLCLQELDRCQQESCGINFITFLCDKYGYCPFPAKIPREEFEELVSYQREDNAKNLLLKWFKLDENRISPEYILQKISLILKEYNSTDGDKRKEARNQWWSDFEVMQKSLKQASSKLNSENRRQYYEISVTEFEILNGLIDTPDPKKTTFAINRHIIDIEDNIGELGAGKFIDIDWDSKLVNCESRERLLLLKDKKVPSILGGANVKSFEILWGKNGVSRDYHADYLQEVADTVCTVVFDSMREHFITANSSSGIGNSSEDALINEIKQGASLLKRLSKNVIIRNDIDQKISGYIKNAASNEFQSTAPLIIYGESGSGKSTIIATAISNMINEVVHGEHSIIFRFIGTTPGTGNTKSLLASLASQMHLISCEKYTDQYGVDNLKEMAKKFKEEVTLLAGPNLVVIFLDALDQLSDVNAITETEWIPRVLPNNVKVIISYATSTSKPSSACFDYLRSIIDSRNFVPVEELKEASCEIIIGNWLKVDERKLSIDQYEVLRLAWSRCPLPLFLKIAYEETKKWYSYTDVTNHPFKSVAKILDLISHLFERLTIVHGKLFFERSLAYLNAARGGLTRQELEDILSCDDDVLDDVFQWWIPPIRRIPQLQVVRLLSDLSDYLVETTSFSDGLPLLQWFHIQFRDSTEMMMQKNIDSKEIHKLLAYYFCGHWAENGKPHVEKGKSNGDAVAVANRKVPRNPLIIQGKLIKDEESARNNMSFVVGSNCKINVRRLNEHCFHLIKGQMFNEAAKTLCNLQYIHSKMLKSRLGDLQEEFALALSEMPSSRMETRMLEDFNSFVLQRGHVIQRYPSLTYQEASNYKSGSYLGDSYEALTEKPFFILKASDSSLEESLFSVIKGHTDIVIAVSFQRMETSKGRRLVASGSLDGRIKLWVYNSGLVDANFKGHQKAVNHLDFLDDELLSISADGKMVLWDAENLAKRVVFEMEDGHGSLIPGNYCELMTNVANERCMWSTWDDGSIRCGNMKGDWVISLGYEYPAISLAFGASCKFFVGYGDGKIKCLEMIIDEDKKSHLEGLGDLLTEDCLAEVFDIHNHEDIFVIVGKQRQIRTQFSEDSNSGWARNAFKNDPYVQKLVAEGMKYTKAIQKKMDLEMSSTGTFLIRKGKDGYCTKCTVDGLPTPHEYVTADLYFPYLATGGSNGSVRLWLIDRPVGCTEIFVSLLQEFGGHTSEVNRVNFSPDGKYLASVRDDTEIRIWSTNEATYMNGQKVLRQSKTGYKLTGCTTNTGGQFTVTWGKRGLVSAWKGDQLIWTKICCSGENISSGAITPNGGKIIVGGDNYYELLEGETGNTFDVKRSCVGRKVKICDFSADGETALLGDDCNIRLVIVEPEMAPLGLNDVKWKAHDNYVTCGQFCPEPNYVCSGSLDGTIKMWSKLQECQISINVGCPVVALNCVLEKFKIAYVVDGEPANDEISVVINTTLGDFVSPSASTIAYEEILQNQESQASPRTNEGNSTDSVKPGLSTKSVLRSTEESDDHSKKNGICWTRNMVLARSPK